MVKPNDEALKQQERILAKTMGDEALKHCHNFVGAIETCYVALDSHWQPDKRNVDCRLLLERVLFQRRHPNEAAEVPPLVRLAVEYADEPTDLRKRALLGMLGFSEDEEVICVANAPSELLRAELGRRREPGVVDHLVRVKGEDLCFRHAEEPTPFHPVQLSVSTEFAERLGMSDDTEITVVVVDPIDGDALSTWASQRVGSDGIGDGEQG